MQIKNELNNPQDSIQAKKEKPFWNPLFPWVLGGLIWYILLGALPKSNLNFIIQNELIGIIITVILYVGGGLIVAVGVCKNYRAAYPLWLVIFLCLLSAAVTAFIGIYVVLATSAIFYGVPF